MKKKLLFTSEVIREIKNELKKSSPFDPVSKEMLELLTRETEIEESLAKKLFFHVSTIRNRNLITKEQQVVLQKSTIAFMGMSVGSHAVANWVMQTRPDSVLIADHDVISPSNLNRLRYGWNQIGRRKINVVSEELFAMHPYIEILKTYKTDLDTIEQFLHSTPLLSAVVDAIDDFEGKIFLRKFCQKKSIPLISAADVGDMVILDIERYDLQPQPELFLGRVPVEFLEDFSHLPEIEKKKLIIKLVGLEKNNEVLLKSLLNIGKSVSTWPQLGATASMAGGIVTVTLKKILLGEAVKSGRYFISLDEILVDRFTEYLESASYRDLQNKVKDKFQL